MSASMFSFFPYSRPPVSTKFTSRSLSCIFWMIWSRVVPATSEVMAILLPTRRLKIEDLPTLGRPTMAIIADI